MQCLISAQLEAVRGCLENFVALATVNHVQSELLTYFQVGIICCCFFAPLSSSVNGKNPDERENGEGGGGGNERRSFVLLFYLHGAHQ